MNRVIRKEYFLSKETAVIMAVLSLLALLVGAGGVWHSDVGWGQEPLVYVIARKPHFFIEHKPYLLDVWFLPPFYPLMPAIKGWYIDAVRRAYPSPLYDIYVEIVPPTFAWGFNYSILGFEVPAIWMPFLAHIPYWLALSYGLSALIHKYREGIKRFLAEV